jgi:hypothetical protein
MNKLVFYIIFLIAFTFFFLPTVSADTIPPNSHSLDRCVKIINLDKFPDIVMMSYITGPMIKNTEINQINNNECLSKGYKFNSLKIYWNTKDKPNSINLDNLLLENIEVYGGYIDQDNPLAKENIEYSIAGFSNGKLVLYKSKQTSEYNNNTPKKIETFSNPLEKIELNNKNYQSTKITSTPIEQSDIALSSSPEPIKKGFWQNIICFFRELFGSHYQ